MTLKLEAVSSAHMLVKFYQTTRCSILEDNKLRMPIVFKYPLMHLEILWLIGPLPSGVSVSSGRSYIEERVMYAVTSRKNIRGLASGFLCGSAPRLYNEDLMQLELELSLELSSAYVSEKRWQLQQRTKRVGSRRLLRIMARKELGYVKEDFIGSCSDRETYKSVTRIRLVKIEKT
jgi:hypothetical protein